MAEAVSGGAGERIAGPRRRVDWSSLASHAILVAACLTILLPVLWTMRTSFANRALAYQPATLVFRPTLDNYAKIFVDEPFLTFFANSVVIALASTAASLAIGAMAAYATARHRTGGAALSFIVLGTQMLPRWRW